LGRARNRHVRLPTRVARESIASLLGEGWICTRERRGARDLDCARHSWGVCPNASARRVLVPNVRRSVSGGGVCLESACLVDHQTTVVGALCVCHGSIAHALFRAAVLLWPHAFFR